MLGISTLFPMIYLSIPAWVTYCIIHEYMSWHLDGCIITMLLFHSYFLVSLSSRFFLDIYHCLWTFRFSSSCSIWKPYWVFIGIMMKICHKLRRTGHFIKLSLLIHEYFSGYCIQTSKAILIFLSLIFYTYLEKTIILF